MLRYYKKTIVASLLAGAVLLLWQTALLAASPKAANGDIYYMFSSYEWTNKGPSMCPKPPEVFKYGTLKVNSYLPASAKQDIPTIIAWYELDKDGNVVGEDPLAVGQYVIESDQVFSFYVSFPEGTTGIFTPVMFVQVDNEWVLAAKGLFGIAKSGAKVDKPGECSLDLATW